MVLQSAHACWSQYISTNWNIPVMFIQWTNNSDANTASIWDSIFYYDSSSMTVHTLSGTNDFWNQTETN